MKYLRRKTDDKAIRYLFWLPAFFVAMLLILLPFYKAVLVLIFFVPLAGVFNSSNQKSDEETGTDKHQAIIARCIKYYDDWHAWQEFVDEYEPYINRYLVSKASQMNIYKPHLIDDWRQDVYTRLFENNFRALESFKAKSENSFYAFWLDFI
jgi:uncharacterized membrane protein